jgi:hypothetical protein
MTKRDQLEKLLEEKEPQAINFINQQIRLGRISQVETCDFIEAYLRALKDDLESPLALGSRVKALRDKITGRLLGEAFSESATEQNPIRPKAATEVTENERLRQRIADTRQQRIETEASTFVAQSIAAGKMSAGEARPFTACYFLAAADDAIALRGVTDRVARLRASVAARMTAGDRRRQLLAMTPAGRRALAKVA